MGRLLNPGLGELADRYTILQLKITKAPADKTAHFIEEQAQVLMRMERYMPFADSEAMDARFAALRQINTDLWVCEDQMAVYATALLVDPPPVAVLGMEIWKLNQHRNQVIQQINYAAGTDRGPEKF